MTNLSDIKILIVDDEPSIVTMLQMVLRREGFQQLHSASTCAEALDLTKRILPDMILLDIMLPDGSGLELCAKLREYGNPHIFFLTAKTSDLDVLRGFSMGGDDYITKPFNPLEVAARIQARIRRLEPEAATAAAAPVKRPESGIYRFSRFTLNEAEGELLVDGHLVPCPAQVFHLLLHFCKYPGIIFSKTQLYDKVWGINGLGDDATVMVHIRRIRERIEIDPGNPKLLLTVRGLGYKLAKESQEQ
ncbi:response regulator transcription factor [Paenibacillus radicis (ex Gao et al. 2016)]|uniref:Transcriptional regulatory protein YvrH n=1 Tax=Paenibacillus radicis (ex Gao et al. 2016) TaxID=1737354 RepID=A0A917GNP0_9BACL|nr:response regulator transcription factor [Paenibacillus radicis (ex Gao et al. 2016)]GGG52016.1 transcriptional regulatory protein YvrH [Paenibacillus radicis (ex Gao et al. 2016)]